MGQHGKCLGYQDGSSTNDLVSARYLSNRIKSKTIILCTTNKGKLSELVLLFKRYNITAQSKSPLIPIKEIKSQIAIYVAAYKAAQASRYEEVFDDAALYIEGLNEHDQVGTDVKHRLNDLKEFRGRRATWEVYLSKRDLIEAHGRPKNIIRIFKGAVQGTMVEGRGDLTYGFHPWFLPDGTDKTFSENKVQLDITPRKQAVHNLVNSKAYAEFCFDCPAISNWEGAYQED